MVIKLKQYNNFSCYAFTLVEVMASVMLLGILMMTIMTAYQGTTDNIIEKIMMEEAMEVAQRRMEILIASKQEPESTDRSGQDDINESYYWTLDLVREQVADTPLTIKNSYIKATVTVGWEQTGSIVLVKLDRFFSDLKPIEGESVAVPLMGNTQAPQWYDDLIDQLGREPTMEEILQHMMEGQGVDLETLEKNEKKAIEESDQFENIK